MKSSKLIFVFIFEYICGRHGLQDLELASQGLPMDLNKDKISSDETLC